MGTLYMLQTTKASGEVDAAGLSQYRGLNDSSRVLGYIQQHSCRKNP